MGSDGAAVRRRASGGVKAGERLCCATLGPAPVGASKQPRLWRGWALLQWVQANSPACGVAGPYSSGCKQTAPPVAWLGPTPVGASKQPRLWRGWALLQRVQANSPCGVAGPCADEFGRDTRGF